MDDMSDSELTEDLQEVREVLGSLRLRVHLRVFVEEGVQTVADLYELGEDDMASFGLDEDERARVLAWQAKPPLTEALWQVQEALRECQMPQDFFDVCVAEGKDSQNDALQESRRTRCLLEHPANNGLVASDANYSLQRSRAHTLHKRLHFFLCRCGECR